MIHKFNIDFRIYEPAYFSTDGVSVCLSLKKTLQESTENKNKIKNSRKQFE
jgi:hypothetical protein